MEQIDVQPAMSEVGRHALSLPGVSRHAILTDCGPLRIPQGQAGKALADPPAFEIVGELGEGAMAVVYRAEQLRPRRQVALKVLKSAGALAARFERETQILAKLQHPGIAQLYVAGTIASNNGLKPSPYIAMELVDGLPLTEYARQKALGPRARVALLVKAALAVAYAHQRGVIHRDLKPGNILVTPGGEPKVLDFGLALSHSYEGRTDYPQTLDGQVLGTLAYMSPEQARHPESADARADVYSLGTVLYELLTERTPLILERQDLAGSLRHIAETDPPRLSTLDKRLQGDLEAIVHKALAKDLGARYASASALADDLNRYLESRPVLARPQSAWYSTRRWMQRHRQGALAFAVGCLLLSCAAAFAYQQSQAAARERRRLTVQELTGLVDKGNAAWTKGSFLDARDIFTRSAEGLDKLGEPSAAARLGLWEVDQSVAKPMATLPAREDEGTLTFAFSDDDKLLACAGASGTVEIRTTPDLRRIQEIRLSRSVGRLQFSADAKWLLAVHDRCASVMEVDSGKILHFLDLPEDRQGFATFWGSSLVTAGERGKLNVAPLSSLTHVQTLSVNDQPIMAVHASPNGLTAVTGEGQLWRLASLPGEFQAVTKLPLTATNPFVSFSQDGHFVAHTVGKVMHVVSVPDGREMIALAGFGRSPASFCETGRIGAFNDGRTDFVILDLEGQPLLHLPVGSSSSVFTGRKLAVVWNADGPWRLWSIAAQPDVQHLFAKGPRELGLAISGDGLRFALAGTRGGTVVLDPQGSEHPGVAGDGGRQLALDGRGERMVIATRGATVQCLDTATGHPCFTTSMLNVKGAAISPDGDVVALCSMIGDTVELWQLRAGGWTKTPIFCGLSTDSVDLSPGGQELLVGGREYCFVYDIRHPEAPRLKIPVRPAPYGRWAVFANGGKMVVENRGVGQLAVWDAGTGQLKRELPDWIERVSSVAASRDTLVVACSGQMVHFIDATTGDVLRSIPSPIRSPARVRVDAQGSTALLTSAGGGAVALRLPSMRFK